MPERDAALGRGLAGKACFIPGVDLGTWPLAVELPSDRKFGQFGGRSFGPPARCRFSSTVSGLRGAQLIR